MTLPELEDETGTFRIGLTHNPDQFLTEKRIIITGVAKSKSDLFQRDAECMESLCGIFKACESNQRC
ncbi:MAG: hypothetical protein RJA81_1023 [Planctomycetota bacterium]|jgi:hypothetical protein